MKSKTLAILSQKTASWHAGASYTNGLLASLALARSSWPGDVLFATEDTDRAEIHDFKCVEIPQHDSCEAWTKFVERHKIDIVLPVRDHRIDYIPTKKIGWIPDFQHFRMPELFSIDDLIWRDRLLSRVAGLSELLILSSQSANADFAEFFSACAHKARVAPFPSQMWSEQLIGNDYVEKKYRLPERYFLVANQFWKHKNHEILPPAIAIARNKGLKVNLVLTGQPVDYRDPDNKLLSSLFQTSSELGVRDSIIFLGQVTRNELIALMRGSIAIIQPSKFEGWNTTIEDAKALAKKVICTNLLVHQEQLGDKALYFEANSHESLAKCIINANKEVVYGYNPENEYNGLQKNRLSAIKFGEQIFKIAMEGIQSDMEKTIPKLPSRDNDISYENRSKNTIIQQQADSIEWLSKRCDLLERGIFIPRFAQRILNLISKKNYHGDS